MYALKVRDLAQQSACCNNGKTNTQTPNDTAQQVNDLRAKKGRERKHDHDCNGDQESGWQATGRGWVSARCSDVPPKGEKDSRFDLVAGGLEGVNDLVVKHDDEDGQGDHNDNDYPSDYVGLG